MTPISLPEAMRLDSLVPTYSRALFYSAFVSWEGWTDEIKCRVEDEGMSLFGEDQPTWYKSACSHVRFKRGSKLNKATGRIYNQRHHALQANRRDAEQKAFCQNADWLAVGRALEPHVPVADLFRQIRR